MHDATCMCAPWRSRCRKDASSPLSLSPFATSAILRAPQERLHPGSCVMDVTLQSRRRPTVRTVVRLTERRRVAAEEPRRAGDPLPGRSAVPPGGGEFAADAALAELSRARRARQLTP